MNPNIWMMSWAGFISSGNQGGRLKLKTPSVWGWPCVFKPSFGKARWCCIVGCHSDLCCTCVGPSVSVLSKAEMDSSTYHQTETTGQRPWIHSEGRATCSDTVTRSTLSCSGEYSHTVRVQGEMLQIFKMWRQTEKQTKTNSFDYICERQFLSLSLDLLFKHLRASEAEEGRFYLWPQQLNDNITHSYPCSLTLHLFLTISDSSCLKQLCLFHK